MAPSSTPSLREVRWRPSELSPRCVGAAARRAGLSPSLCDAPRRSPGLRFLQTLTPLIRENSEVFPEFLWIPDLSPLTIISSERDLTVQEVRSFSKVFFLAISNPAAAQVENPFMCLGVAGGTIERSCYSY